MKRVGILVLLGLLVLAIPAAVVVAGRPDSTGLDNAAIHAGKTLPANGGAGQSGQGGESQGNGERPHNHGWYVSQVARDHSTTGRAHGEAVSTAARDSAGKPDAAN